MNLKEALAISVVLHLLLLTPAQNAHLLYQQHSPQSSHQQIEQGALHALLMPAQNPNRGIEEKIAEQAITEQRNKPAQPTQTGKHLEKFTSRPPQLISSPEQEIWLSGPGEAGEVQLRIWIDRHGTPRRLEVLRSTVRHEAEELIVLRFFTARYFPAQENGMAIDSIAEFQISVGKKASPSPEEDREPRQDPQKESIKASPTL